MTFEENIARLEELTDEIRRNDIGIEDALKTFEEGIKLAKTLEKELDKIEGKIQILMNSPLDEIQEDNQETTNSENDNDNEKVEYKDSALELDLFAPDLDSPTEGLRR